MFAVGKVKKVHPTLGLRPGYSRTRQEIDLRLKTRPRAGYLSALDSVFLARPAPLHVRVAWIPSTSALPTEPVSVLHGWSYMVFFCGVWGIRPARLRLL